MYYAGAGDLVMLSIIIKLWQKICICITFIYVLNVPDIPNYVLAKYYLISAKSHYIINRLLPSFSIVISSHFEDRIRNKS